MFDDVQYDMFTGKAVDAVGRPLSKKETKRRVLAKNRRKGKATEDEVKMALQLQGYDVQRSPKGKDFIVRKSDFFGRITQTKHVEVKSGNAKMSKLQKATKKKKSNYRMIRIDPLDFW